MTTTPNLLAFPTMRKPRVTIPVWKLHVIHHPAVTIGTYRADPKGETLYLAADTEASAVNKARRLYRQQWNISPEVHVLGECLDLSGLDKACQTALLLNERVTAHTLKGMRGWVAAGGHAVAREERKADWFANEFNRLMQNA